MRAVFDPNVIISGVLSRSGNAAWLLGACESGACELVASPALLSELERALAYPKLRRRSSKRDARAVLAWLRQSATVVPDPHPEPPVCSVDPGDDYLISLAASERAILVSGDRDLLDLADDIPVFTPAQFRARLSAADAVDP